MSGVSVEAKGISWHPNGRTRVLEPVSFVLQAGEILCLIGPNGAGKSTLLRLLYRYHRPSSGNVLIGGVDIWKMNSRETAKIIAAVLQEQPSDFSLTVREIVTLGRAPYRRGMATSGINENKIVSTSLERLDLLHLEDRMLDTLSGGERQRVMLARALVQEPQILVLDEPTNHLDIRNQLEMLDMIKQLGMTIICCLHDLNAALKLADKVLVLAHGRCLAFGTAQEIMSSSLIAKAFSVKVRQDSLNGSGESHFTFHL